MLRLEHVTRLRETRDSNRTPGVRLPRDMADTREALVGQEPHTEHSWDTHGTLLGYAWDAHGTRPGRSWNAREA